MNNLFAKKIETSLETAIAVLTPDLKVARVGCAQNKNCVLVIGNWCCFYVQLAAKFRSLEWCEVVCLVKL